MSCSVECWVHASGLCLCDCPLIMKCCSILLNSPDQSCFSELPVVWYSANGGLTNLATIGLASDGVTNLSNVWQRGKLVLNKDSAPYKSMLGENTLTGRSSLFLRGEVWTVLTTRSQVSVSHFKRYRGSDKCRAVFQSIDDLPACFCAGRYLCLEPILPVATPVAALWRSTCKPN